ncbi:PaaI family thioesterase [Staphylococcus gallinarum]|jgi:1,4-dihydroxy-2-naphthoyl-CoA hydrolase|uniref:PaaI family thioesterase n=1 Tax=Staphylococcus gallinarum TaxID=1293 RepID=UPI00211BD280|nr:PaaI family thioesterase [Staphylococcus gallinarum]MCQ9289217.1 PaaI family thioesterase [Staphylococcus gallinarum]
MTNMIETLEMKVESEAHGKIVMSMPVTDKVKQPFGYLHGGANLALGETACSVGAAHIIDTEKFIPLGLEMNANHISSTTEGTVYATATIVHEGKTTQVWNIEIKDDVDRLISIMRGTIAIKPRK